LGLNGEIETIPKNRIYYWSKENSFKPLSDKHLNKENLSFLIFLFKLSILSFFNKDKNLKIGFREYLLKNNVPTHQINIINDILNCLCSIDISKVSAYFGLNIIMIAIYPCYIYKEGMDVLINALISRLNRKLLLNSEVLSLELTNNTYLIKYKQDGKIKDARANLVISSAPLPILKKIYPAFPIDLDYSPFYALVIKGKFNFPNHKFNFITIQANEWGVKGIIDNNGDYYTIYVESFDANLSYFFKEYKIMERIKIEHGLPIVPIQNPITNVSFPNLPNFYICGDFYKSPSLEAAVLSAKIVAEEIKKKLKK
ncbi:MAG: FAD-dependent oxidoreductase, partial [Candidatus Saganbacteria bacterium]|nr:FAD-dependent oxidoreductase [Candidatus Saganbacteria bacterium]